MLADTTALDGKLEEVKKALNRSGAARVSVVGPVGTGRSTLAASLSKLADVAYVELPSLGPDAVEHGLYQLGSYANTEDAYQTKMPLRERIVRTSRRLNNNGQCLVMLLPSSWDWWKPARDERLFLDQAKDFIQAVASTVERVVLISSRRLDVWSSHDHTQVLLEELPVNWRALRDQSLWGELLGSAQRLSEKTSDFKSPSPIAVRLAVGALALEIELKDVLAGLSRNDSIEFLARLLKTRLEDRHPELHKTAVGLAKTRFPLKKTSISQWLGETDHKTLFTQCLAYGEDCVKMTEPVRRVFQRDWRRISDDAYKATTHKSFSDIYASADGAKSPRGLDQKTTIAWLESTYHLGQAGPDYLALWRQKLEGLPEVAFLWGHGRSLSRDFHCYEQAAAVFEHCVELLKSEPNSESARFRRSYSWHYLAFNLHRARKDPQRVEEGYLKAIELESKNPWWHRRYFTFLNHRARFVAAEDFWRQQCSRLVPRQTEMGDLKDFVQGSARVCLGHGRPELALEILMSTDSLDQDPQQQSLLQDCLHQLECFELNEEVYHPRFPIARRWKRPIELPQTLDSGAELQTWHPLRVLEANISQVHIVFAMLDAKNQKRVLKKVLTAEQWELASGEPAPRAEVFYFLGAYSGKQLRIHPQPVPDERIKDRRPRYWERWI